VSVLTDIDLCPRDDGVLVTARQDRPGAVLVGQAELAETLGDHDPLSAAGRRRMSVLLQLYRLVADHGEHPDDVQPLPSSLAARLDLRPAEWWPDLGEHVERMGGLAATRIARDGRPVLRPVGGCDVPTLLASASLRAQLSAHTGGGVTMLPAAFTATEDHQRAGTGERPADTLALSAPGRAVPHPT
jgi:hypothetical protein